MLFTFVGKEAHMTVHMNDPPTPYQFSITLEDDVTTRIYYMKNFIRLLNCVNKLYMALYLLLNVGDILVNILQSKFCV